MPIEPSVAAAVLLYLLLAALPGLAVLRLLGLRPADPFVTLGVGAGVGLALQPLIYLWAHALGLHLGRPFWWLFVGGAATVLAAGRRWHGPGHWSVAPGRWRTLATGALGAPGALIVVLGLVLACRWWVARELVAPMWGDSVHHTMIVQLFLTHGGLVDDWQPLAPLATFTYHFGLHAGVTSLAWLANLPAHRALIVAGQVLSMLGVLTAYALVAGLSGRRWAGIGAALAAGGLSTMPAYYINWGRYTQLAGQVILPAAALAAVWAAGGWGVGVVLPARGVGVTSPAEGVPAGVPAGAPGRAGWPTALPIGRRAVRDDARGHPPAGPVDVVAGAAGWTGWRGVLLAAILAAGLFLTHYLVVLFYGLFLVAWLVVGVVGAAGAASAVGVAGALPYRRIRAGRRLAGVAVTALVLVVPWLPQFAAGPLGGTAVQLSTGRLANPAVFGVVAPSYVWSSVGHHLGWPLVVATVAGAAWGLRRRDRTVRLGVSWIALLLLAAYPWLIGLPITGVLKDFTVVIGLYVPAGLVVGGALAGLGQGLERRGLAGRRVVWLAAVALAAALVWKDSAVVEPGHAYVTPADERAMVWIRAHTPLDAVFLVGALPAFGDTVVVGEDAGWWIGLLADRRTTVAPATIGTERSIDPGYRERLNHLAELWRADLDAPAARAALAAEGVSHAFVGQRARQMDAAGQGSGLAKRLAASPYWELVYHDENGVQVYAYRTIGQ